MNMFTKYFNIRYQIGGEVSMSIFCSKWLLDFASESGGRRGCEQKDWKGCCVDLLRVAMQATICSGLTNGDLKERLFKILFILTG